MAIRNNIKKLKPMKTLAEQVKENAKFQNMRDNAVAQNALKGLQAKYKNNNGPRIIIAFD